MKSPKNLLGIPKRSSGKDLGYAKNQNLVVEHGFQGQNPTVTRTKTDGRIGSVTPPRMLKGGFSVTRPMDVQPRGAGSLGSAAAGHMSPSHSTQGTHYSARVAKSRAMANAGRAAQHRTHTEPVNVQRGVLKHQKPD